MDEPVIDPNTAKPLGLGVPPALLTHADEVIKVIVATPAGGCVVDVTLDLAADDPASPPRPPRRESSGDFS